MAPVSPEIRASYTTTIDSILTTSDLNTISEKRIRKGLQDAVGKDLSHQKVCLGRADPLSPCPYPPQFVTRQPI
jgi:hypothetical protein